MVRVIVADTKIDCEHLLGQFLDESHYDVLIEEDTDCYGVAGFSTSELSEDRIAFKFRKNFFSEKEQRQAYLGLREAATLSQNRGLASGPKDEKCLNREWVTEYQYRLLSALTTVYQPPNQSLQETVNQTASEMKAMYENEETTRGLVWLASETGDDEFKFDEWVSTVGKKVSSTDKLRAEAKRILDKYISDTTYANPVNSGIAGYFDRYPRIPYGRATSYTEHNYEKFQMAFPFLKTLSKGFRELLPNRWKAQKAECDKIDSKFVVPGTVFTTITVNKTFRTAAHRDAGDLDTGLSNLLVLSNDGNYTGGYLIFPEYRIAVNVRPGDLLLVNNHEIIHGNTPIVLGSPTSDRVSLVCYFRKKMVELGSWEYENLRYRFVEDRRKNSEHKLWTKKWNGVSAGMWSEKEWYDYLEQNGGREMVAKYHPEAYHKESTLESLFG